MVSYVILMYSVWTMVISVCHLNCQYVFRIQCMFVIPAVRRYDVHINNIALLYYSCSLSVWMFIFSDLYIFFFYHFSYSIYGVGVDAMLE